VAREAMCADAWATALTVMGARRGFAFAQRTGLAVRFVTVEADGSQRVLATPAFDAWIAS
ncbi:MAG: FAD:protein FMN transferase, partial [Luteimonas sp.]|nr:FAD:protein FMN transferase [Luteimonas sp.]